MAVAWQASLVQDVHPDYKTKWIGKNFPKWTAFAAETAAVPGSAFRPNKKSQEERARASGDRSEVDPDALEYHLASTLGLLTTHLYWMTKLQDGATVGSAFTNLEVFLGRALSGTKSRCFVSPGLAPADLDAAWPLSSGEIVLPVEGASIRIEGLMAMPRVWEEIAQSDDLPITRSFGTSAAASSSAAPPAAPRLWVPLVHLLCLLQCSAHDACNRVLGQVLRFVAHAVDCGCWVASAQPNALRASVTQANKRARTIGSTLKDQIAEAAAKGEVARTARKVVRCMGKFKLVQQATIQEGSVGDATDIRCGRYWMACQRTMKLPEAGPFLSIGQDGTRVAGLDMLFSCLFSTSLAVGCWMPPMV